MPTRQHLLLALSVLTLLTACGKKEFILKDRSFDELQLEDHSTHKVWITKDPAVIAELKEQVYFIDDNKCRSSVPDYAIITRINNKMADRFFYCYDRQTNIDELKAKMTEAAERTERFASKEEWLQKIAHLWKDRRSSVEVAVPDSATITGTGHIGVIITDSSTDDFTHYGHELTKLLAEHLSVREQDIKVVGYSKAKDGSLVYSLDMRCDSNVGTQLDEMSKAISGFAPRNKITPFEKDDYKIVYRTW